MKAGTSNKKGDRADFAEGDAEALDRIVSGRTRTPRSSFGGRSPRSSFGASAAAAPLHGRRATMFGAGAYNKAQQGEAEALLHRPHAAQFTDAGDSGRLGAGAAIVDTAQQMLPGVLGEAFTTGVSTVAKMASMDSVNKELHLIKTLLMYLMIIIDILFNSSLNDDDWFEIMNRSDFGPIMLFGIQVGAQVFCFMFLFLMASSTYLFRMGLLNRLMWDFRYTLLSVLIYWGLSIWQGVLRIMILTHQRRFEYRDLWDSTVFGTVYVFTVLVSGVYYYLLIYASIRLADPRYYTPLYWVHHLTGVHGEFD